MGNWHISIQGIGPHHNTDYENDAKKLAEKFTKELKDKGHRITYATFTEGSMEDLKFS